MIANIAGGVLMWAVHFLARKTGPEEYGVFLAFLAVAMCVPTMPLQMVLAQQTAQGLATNHRGEVAGMIRLVWLASFVLWLAGVGLAVLWHAEILARWQIPNPWAFWIMLPALLFSLWGPMFSGVLQGQQNFLWLGWVMMLNGVGRLGIAALVVVVLHAAATGMVIGVLVGLVISGGLAIWQTRSLWSGPALPCDWRRLLRQVFPLVLGFGAFQFLFTADTMFAKTYFASATVGFYGSAGTLSRALMWLVGPLATVMFPRIVHSSAKSEKSNLMLMVFAGTGVLAVVGAAGLSVLGPFVVQIIYGKAYVQLASQVLPWYAGAMVPLALSNVLVNNLLARASFRIVLPMCVLAGGYAFALTRFHDTPVMLLQTTGVCSSILLVLCTGATLLDKTTAKTAAA